MANKICGVNAMYVVKKLLIMGSLFSLGCFSRPEFLETKYWSGKGISARQEGSNVVITVTGLCGHSALGVEKALMDVDGDVLRVELLLRQGCPGTINERIVVPKDVDKVFFAGDLIWQRRR